MGRLIIDGNSVFEIDEECMKRRRPVKECDVEKYIQNEMSSTVIDSKNSSIQKER